MTFTQYALMVVMVVGIIFTIITPKKIETNISRRFWIVFLIVLVIIAVGRPLKMADYSSYVRIVKEFDVGRYEPATVLVNYFVHFSSSPVTWFFIIYAFLGIGLKLYAIKSISPLFYGGIIVYLSNFFVLHDLVQIRAAVASGCVLMMIKFSVERNLKKYLVFYLIAVMFHYSALIGGFIWFLRPNSTRRWWYIIALIACYYIGHHLQTIAQSVTPLLAVLFSDNSAALQVGEDDTFLLQIKQIYICAAFWFFVNKLKANPVSIIALKTYTIGICFGWMFSEFSNLAMRTADMLIISEILLIPSVIYIFRNRVLASIIVVLYVLYTFRGVIISPDYWNPV